MCVDWAALLLFCPRPGRPNRRRSAVGLSSLSPTAFPLTTTLPPLPPHQSRDIHLDSFTLLFHGHELLADAKLELNYGR